MLNRLLLLPIVGTFWVNAARDVHAAQVQLQMRLLSADGNDTELVPGANGSCTLPTGSDFKVGVYGKVLDPILTGQVVVAPAWTTSRLASRY